MATYGVTGTGFSVPRLTDIRESIISDLQSSLGVEVNTKPNSVTGQLIDVMSEHYLALWEEMYNAFRQLHPQYAEENHLDLVTGYTSVTRKRAGKTTGYVRVSGSIGSTIPASTQIRDGNTGVIYETDSEVTISRNRLNLVRIEPHMALDTSYSITISGVDVVFNSGNSASSTALMKYMIAQIKAMGFNASSSGGVLTISSPPPATFSFIINSGFEENETAACVAITASEAGAYTLSSGSSVSLVTSVAGVDSVSLPYAGVTGAALEQDSDLRARYYTSLFSPGQNTASAIRAAIENQVLGVTACRVFSNDTSSADSMGRPAHSLHAVVQGGSSDDIANIILAESPAGIESFGNELVVTQDSYGEQYDIRFDRPEEVFVWVRMEVTKLPSSEERYPSNSVEIIKNAVVSGASADHGIGSDVVIGRLNSYAYRQSGVAYVLTGVYTTTMPTDEPTEADYKHENIEIKDNQIAVFDAARIEVI